MAQTLQLNNFDSLNILARTKLTSDATAGLSSVAVANTADFSGGGPVLIGDIGQPNAELLTATRPSTATALPVSTATKLAHNDGDDVTLLFGDHIRVYRATDIYGTGQQPPDANFTNVATVTIDPTSGTTAYTDTSGAAGNWYKFTYYNATTTAETSLADSRAGQAGQTHYASLDAIRDAAGFTSNRNVTDAMIAAKRDAAEKEINGALLPVYQFPLPQPTNPIIVEITKQLAAGMLIHELYTSVSPAMAEEGETKANKARNGGGSFTGLQELVMRDVVLTDAQFNEQTIDEGHGFGGYPDNTTIEADGNGLAGAYFATDMEY